MVERLPVPQLKETLDLYLRLVRPLLSDDRDYEETKKIVTRFEAQEGRTLHERLLAHRETPGLVNWLEPFWDEWYLCDDTPVVINVSPGLGLRMPRSSDPLVATSQTGRASKLVRAALEWKALSESEPTRLLPELENGKPMCTFEFTRILCGNRVPHLKRDLLEYHPTSKHIVVVRHNRFFSLDVVDPSGIPYSHQEIEESIKEIMDTVDDEFEKQGLMGIPLGAMTAGNRKLWAKNREELRQMNSRNWNSLMRIESSILLLALEPEAPPSTICNESAMLFLHGDCQNRWFDKTVQFIVARNGVSGICMEHSGFDGATLCRFANFITDFEDELLSQHKENNCLSIGPPFYELKFEAHTHTLQAAVDEANKLMRSLDLQVFHFKKFGKREIVKQKTSPDGFVQMAFQLSYRLLTGKTASTYESANTKRFAHGRTEAIRCVSVQSQAFVTAFLANPESKETASALRAAIDEHSAIARKCKQNSGVDRHLMGLRRMIFSHEPVPEIFTNRAYPLLSRSVLSTSNLGSNKGVDLVCFGPVTDEGFGLCYMIHDYSLQVHVANFHGLSSSFAALLDSCLIQMLHLLAMKPLPAKL